MTSLASETLIVPFLHHHVCFVVDSSAPAQGGQRSARSDGRPGPPSKASPSTLSIRALVKEEFRFGHKRWHRVALVVLAIPFDYMALIFGADAGELGVATGFGGAAAILMLLALLAH
jgi:hypothetical protein